MLKANCIAYGSLLVATPAFAQSPPLAPSVDAFYSTTAKADELQVKTKEGCGWFVPQPDQGTLRTVPTIVATIVESAKRDSWEGACHEGLALGPGRKLSYNDQGKLVSISELWALRGRPIGVVLTTIMANDRYDMAFHEAVSWLGTSYSRNVRGVTPLEPKDGPTYPPSVAVDFPDPKSSVRYTLAAPYLQAPARIVQMSLTEKYLQSGRYFDRLTDYPCPSGCGALWVERAGPIIRGFDDFERQHAAEIARVKVSHAALLKPLLAERPKLQAVPTGPAAPGMKARARAKGEWVAN